VPPRQPVKPISVQAVKRFFESRASQHHSAPVSEPSGGTKTSNKKILRTEQAPVPSQAEPSYAESAHAHEPTKSTGQGPPRQTNTLARPQAKASPNVVERQVVERQDSPIPEGFLPAADTGLDETASRRRQASTILMNTSSRDTKSLGFERRTLEDSSKLDEASNAPLVAVEKAGQSRQRQDSEDTVRRRSIRRSTSAAEPEEARAIGRLGCPQKSRRSESGQDLRDAVDEDTGTSIHRVRRRRSQSAPLKPEEEDYARSSKHGSTKRSVSSRNHESNTYRDTVNEIVAPRGLSHDGSSSDLRPSQRSTVHGNVPTANIGVQLDFFDVEVPDHVDWRSAYGRRKTQDFGFPGARIKPRKTLNTYKSLKDPSDWIRRTCGHFSHMGKSEVRSDPAQRPCRQCLAKHPLPNPHESRIHSMRKRAVTESSISNPSISSVPSIRRVRSPRRRRHHSECMPANKCGDTFAKDLGYIVGQIIDEHTNSLQGVINNIKQTQPSLAQLRRVSEDLVQCCQQGATCTIVKLTSCRSQCTHQAACQPVQHMYIPMCQPRCQPMCQLVGQPQACQWQPPCPSVPPKPAEKLNAGSPGQVKPNVNDSPSTLREAVQTIPDLVDLVNSAADNLGVDLDRRPTSHDDQTFQDAPVKDPLPASSLSRHSSPFQSIQWEPIDDEYTSEDPWLQ
jgi:hypothetical protein